MKLKDYIKKLNDLTKESPEALDYDVVCSKDDEGNGFNPVIFNPTIGEFSDGEEGSSNVVCLN